MSLTRARVAIIGDYDASRESHRATDAALVHASSALSLDLEPIWLTTSSIGASSADQTLASFDGFLIAPGSPYKNMDGALRAIQFARESGRPLLGTCGGFQHVILEYARHVLGIPDAAHAEYNPDASSLFISRLSCSLAGRTLVISLKSGSLVAQLYGKITATEQYYCNFGVNPDYNAVLASSQLAIVGSDAEGEIRIVELHDHPFFVGTLFVPQMRSRPGKPHPLVLGFVKAVQSVRNA